MISLINCFGLESDFNMRNIWLITINLAIFANVVCSVNLTFPDNFLIGAATAAYQIEGAWNVSGKGENVWDYFTHTYPEKMTDGSNGDDACKSYYKYLEDVAVAKELGLDFYRLSISWSRVLTTGFTDQINEEGIQYYVNLTQALIANGIEPVVTLYHWDHPQIIEDLGGWTNPLMVDYFVNYATVIFDALAPYVKVWITINEPVAYCNGGYRTAIRAPGKSLESIGYYQCAINTLKAHASVYHLFNNTYRSANDGEIGIDVYCRAWLPSETNDAELIERANLWDCGIWMHPILIGDYPEVMKTRIANLSAAEGYSASRLPELSEYWINYINGTADFFGVNYYTSGIPEHADDYDDNLAYPDCGFVDTVGEYYPTANTSWLYIVPEGLGLLLRWIRDTYDNPKIYILENGRPDNGRLDDYDRIQYFYDHLTVLLAAIEDGCNVQRYTIWSLLDNFEWASGYTELFGITKVDFDDDERPRTPKLSSAWWQQIIKTRTLQEVPTNNSLRIGSCG